MANLNYHLIFHALSVCAFHLISVKSSELLPDSFQRWTHSVRLEQGVDVRWNAEDPYYLTMEVSAPTKGYVGVGFSPTGGMQGSDIMIGWVDSDGIPHIGDFYAPDKSQPIQDDQQDYDLVAASEREGITTIRFRRRWDTCDFKNDMKLGNDTVRLIWAYHQTDPATVPNLQFNWHGITSRGVRSVLMRTPTNQMRFPDTGAGDRRLMRWDVTLNRARIEAKENSHICKIVKFPVSQRKQHIVGFRPIITPENAGNVYLISVYHCSVPEHLGGTRRVFEQYAASSGRDCYSPGTPPEWNNYCFAYLFTWGQGSEGEMLPTHVGIPLGERSDESTYFKLEVHYENPTLRTFTDSSGMRIFYTDQLRRNDAATLFLGHKVTPFQMIPQAQQSFKTFSFCSGECTQNGIMSPAGLKAVNVMLQTRLAGKKITVRHIRDGKELPPISQDNTFDSSYQQSRALNQEVTILPGDDLIVECEYDTSNKNRATFGGISNHHELCEAMITYYPKTDLRDCRSQPEFFSFFHAFGMQNVSEDLFNPTSYTQRKSGQGKVQFNSALLSSIKKTGLNQPDKTFQITAWEAGSLENPFDLIRVTSPASVGNISVGEFLRRMNWEDRSMVKRIEKSLRDGLHYMFCANTGQRRATVEQNTVRFPTFDPYNDPSPSTCRYDNAGTITRTNTVVTSTMLSIAALVRNFLKSA